jgi:hypothetical protein
MRTHIKWFCWILPIGLLWACSVQSATVPPTGTPVPLAATHKAFTATYSPTSTAYWTSTATSTEPPAATATAPKAVEVNLGSVHFVIPAGLASSAKVETTTDIEWPAVNPSFGTFPEHWVITLNGYVLSKTSKAPRIIIFRTDEAIGIYDSQIKALRRLKDKGSLAKLPDQTVSRLTMVIVSFKAQISQVSSSSNIGVRHLTQVFYMDVCPITNEEIFYYYNGLSSDGNYFIFAELPVHASFLQTSPNSRLVPAGGIPFPEGCTAEQLGQQSCDAGEAKQYLQDITDKINAGGPGDWRPSLSVLDELISSIHID